ncbi:MAG: efflux RND transporter periplasmic adaptor subunit [Microgenomates group bacterium]
MKIKENISYLSNWIRRRKKTVIVAIILLAGAGIWWSRSQADEELQYTFSPVENRELVKSLDVSGFVDAKQKARMRFAAGGKITYLGAKEGDAVKKWQTVARIDQATLQKQLDQDLNNYLKERLDWENTRDAVEDRAIETAEQRTVEQNQLDLTNTVLNVEIRDIAIQNTLLSAPFDGILTVSPVTTTGIQLGATDYFEIVDPTSMIFRATVDEADIATLVLGQKTIINLDSYPDDEIETAISYISFVSTETSSGTAFVIELPITQEQSARLLRIGMNGDASIELERVSDALVIPLIATKERDGKTYVDVRTGENEVEEREITIGLETESELQVLSGLSASDQIAIPE